MSLKNLLYRVRPLVSPSKAKRGTLAKRRPMVEPLERREMLTSAFGFVDLFIGPIQQVQEANASQAGEYAQALQLGEGQSPSPSRHEVQVFLLDSALIIRGSPGADQIRVRLVGHVLDVNASWAAPSTGESGSGGMLIQRTPSSLVREIVIFGDAGNDWIEVAEAVKVPTRLFGSAGDDTILGGGGNDLIDGGSGDNFIFDRESVDQVFSAMDAIDDESAGFLPPAMEEFGVKSAPSSVTVVTPNLTNGILTVRGTNNNDTITLTKSGGWIHNGRWVAGVWVGGWIYQAGRFINVAGKSYLSADVKSIVIVGERGDDKITVDTSITQTTWIFGGHGNDTITGGGGTNYIYGGPGNDKLTGGPKTDYIWGGSGTDTLNGGRGTNYLYNRPARRTYSMNALEREIVRLTNIERTKRGLPALIVDTRIARAAHEHSEQMASRSKVIGDAAAHSHNLWGVHLPTVSTRFDYAGFEWSSFRENIAAGYSKAADVVNAWMNSPGHRTNILSTDITHIGVSAVKNARGRLFFTQNFGRPR